MENGSNGPIFQQVHEPSSATERLPNHQTEALVSFTGSADHANYTAGSRILCPGCQHTVGVVPPNTVCTVRTITTNSECQPGGSAHLCTIRHGKPARKCGTRYELRSVETRAAA